MSRRNLPSLQGMRIHAISKLFVMLSVSTTGKLSLIFMRGFQALRGKWRLLTR